MRSKAATLILTALIFATMTLTASAQIPLNMSYQARLADSTGNPVPDGPYDLEFNFYSDSTGGVPVWTEQFFGVLTSNGFFDVFVEMELNNLNGPLFMEVSVGGEILSPRTRMASVPYSAISHRMQGDIITDEGFMFLVNADGDSCIEMSGNGAQSSFRMIDPVDKREGFVAMTEASGNTMKLMNPDDDTASAIIMSAGPLRSSIKMIDPVDKREGFVLSTETSGNSIKLIDPGDENVAIVDMVADGNGGKFKVNYYDAPSYLEKPGIEIFTEDGGIGGQAGIFMFNPQPEPPAGDPVIEMKTMLNDAAYFAMNNLSGAEVGPLLEMTTDPTASSRILIHAAQPTFSGRVEIQAQYTDGANMTMFREGLVPHNEFKAMDLRIGSDIGGEFNIYNYASDVEQEMLAISGSPSAGASFRMFNPQPEPPARLMLDMNTDQYGATFAMAAPQAAGSGEEITDPMVEIIADSSGGAIDLYNEISKYMGLEPCPFEPGGLLQMYDPIADAVKFEVMTTEDGAGIDIYDEIGKYMGLDPSPFTPGGYLYMIESTGFVIDTNITMGSDGYIQVEKGVTIGPNSNSGSHTLVIGANTSASGDNSFAGGRHAQADHNNCFIWSDLPIGPSILPLQTSSDNQFLIRSAGGIQFYTNAGLTSGVELTPGATSWSSITSLDGVRNLRSAESEDILGKIEMLPINRYSYKSENESVEHIGPMADDFHNQFGVGVDDEHISAQDQSGIALAGIKEMINIINDLKDKNAELERRIADLERTR